VDSEVALPIACVEVATLPEGVAGLSDPHEQAMITMTRMKEMNTSQALLVVFTLSSST
jgi:hypothetical protein